MSWANALASAAFELLKRDAPVDIPNVLVRLVSEYGADITSVQLASRVVVMQSSIKPPDLLGTMVNMTRLGVFPLAAMEHAWSSFSREQMVGLQMNVGANEEWVVSIANRPQSTDIKLEIIHGRYMCATTKTFTMDKTDGFQNVRFEIPSSLVGWSMFLHELSSTGAIQEFISTYINYHIPYKGSAGWFLHWITTSTTVPITDEIWNLLTVPHFDSTLLRRDSRDASVIPPATLVFFISLLAIHSRLRNLLLPCSVIIA